MHIKKIILLPLSYLGDPSSRADTSSLRISEYSSVVERPSSSTSTPAEAFACCWGALAEDVDVDVDADEEEEEEEEDDDNDDDGIDVDANIGVADIELSAAA